MALSTDPDAHRHLPRWVRWSGLARAVLPPAARPRFWTILRIDLFGLGATAIDGAGTGLVLGAVFTGGVLPLLALAAATVVMLTRRRAATISRIRWAADALAS